MNLKIINGLLLCSLLIPFLSCEDIETADLDERSPQKETKTTIIKELKPELNKITPSIKTPEFNEDSSYFFIKKQVDFGPRVPNYQEHEDCANWLISKMKNYGFDVIIQEGKVTAFNDCLKNPETPSL